VIAIMAILAAVAVIGVSVYIPKAQQAADDQLLHDINYIFQAACLENGLDVSDIDSASWDMETMLVTSVNGDEEHPVVDSFKTHFDLTDATFNDLEIKALLFDSVKHLFVPNTVDSISVTYAGVVIELDPDDVQALRESAFAEIGSENLLAMVDKATGLINFGDPNASLTKLANSTGAKTFLYEKLGVSNDEEIYGLLETQYPQGEMTDDEYNAFLDVKFNEVVANNAVLYAAQNSESASEGIWDVLKADSVKDTIKSNTNTEEQLAQSAMAIAMYSAYTKTDSLENVPLTDVYATLDSAAFKAYLETEQAKKDLDGYLASMNVVNDGVSSGSDAAQKVLLNGFGDKDLAVIMSQLIGN